MSKSRWLQSRLLVRSRPQFGRLFFAHAVSRAGDAFNTVALVILVFQLTGSGIGVAGTVFFEVVALLVFAPIAGVLVDRLPRRSVMVAADLARALLVGVLAVWHNNVAIAYAVAFGVATASSVAEPIQARSLPAASLDPRLRSHTCRSRAATTAHSTRSPSNITRTASNSKVRAAHRWISANTCIK